jgi:hypothetical protein
MRVQNPSQQQQYNPNDKLPRNDAPPAHASSAQSRASAAQGPSYGQGTPLLSSGAHRQGIDAPSSSQPAAAGRLGQSSTSSSPPRREQRAETHSGRENSNVSTKKRLTILEKKFHNSSQPGAHQAIDSQQKVLPYPDGMSKSNQLSGTSVRNKRDTDENSLTPASERSSDSSDSSQGAEVTTKYDPTGGRSPLEQFWASRESEEEYLQEIAAASKKSREETQSTSLPAISSQKDTTEFQIPRPKLNSKDSKPGTSGTADSLSVIPLPNDQTPFKIPRPKLNSKGSKPGTSGTADSLSVIPLSKDQTPLKIPRPKLNGKSSKAGESVLGRPLPKRTQDKINYFLGKNATNENTRNNIDRNDKPLKRHQKGLTIKDVSNHTKADRRVTGSDHLGPRVVPMLYSLEMRPSPVERPASDILRGPKRIDGKLVVPEATPVESAISGAEFSTQVGLDIFDISRTFANPNSTALEKSEAVTSFANNSAMAAASAFGDSVPGMTGKFLSAWGSKTAPVIQGAYGIKDIADGARNKDGYLTASGVLSTTSAALAVSPVPGARAAALAAAVGGWALKQVSSAKDYEHQRENYFISRVGNKENNRGFDYAWYSKPNITGSHHSTKTDKERERALDPRQFEHAIYGPTVEINRLTPPDPKHFADKAHKNNSYTASLIHSAWPIKLEQVGAQPGSDVHDTNKNNVYDGYLGFKISDREFDGNNAAPKHIIYTTNSNLQSYFNGNKPVQDRINQFNKGLPGGDLIDSMNENPGTIIKSGAGDDTVISTGQEGVLDGGAGKDMLILRKGGNILEFSQSLKYREIVNNRAKLNSDTLVSNFEGFRFGGSDNRVIVNGHSYANRVNVPVFIADPQEKNNVVTVKLPKDSESRIVQTGNLKQIDTPLGRSYVPDLNQIINNNRLIALESGFSEVKFEPYQLEE